MSDDPRHEWARRWPTSLGVWLPGESVKVRGKDLFADLKGISWIGLLLFAVTGREHSDRQVRLFEGIWTISTSFPDPRLWNNRIAALAGTARSTSSLAAGGATAVSEAITYGHRVNFRTVDFFFRLRGHLQGGGSVEDFVRGELRERRVVPGFGRPLTRIDERIGPLMELVKELGFEQGECLKLAFEVDEVMRLGRWRMGMNITGLAAALAIDQGMSAREYYHYLTFCFSAGVVPCFVDALEHDEGSFFPLPCNALKYAGPKRRSWPGGQ